ncbi:MAG: putative signal-transducing histidine kinase, partial [Haloquadratum sp. J07HQX50]
ANTSEYSKKRGAEIIDRVAESSATEEFEWVVKDSSGETHIMLVNATLATIDGSDRVLATSQEITARRKREAVMENLQGAIDKMQAAENVEQIYRIVEKTAEEVLQLPRTACWGYDESEEQLQCVSQTESGEFGPDILPPESPEYTAFQAGNTLEYSPAENHQEASVQTAILTPIRDYGILAAGQCQRGDYEPYLTDAAQVLTAHAAVALDRIHRGKRLKESETRLQAIINRIDEAILLLPVSKLNQPRPEPDYVSSGYDDLLGTPLGTIHEVFDEGFFGALHPDDYDSYCRFIESIQADVQAGEVDQRYIRTYRIRLHDGTTKWIRSEYYPTSWLEGEPRIVIVSRDITERKAREETIESFHDITAKLTTTEAVHEAGNIAVNAAASVFDIPTTAVYTYQEGSGELSLISTGPDMNADRIPDTLTADTQPVWETFIGESMQIESVEATPVLQTDSYQYVFMLPLGTNGVLIIWGKKSSFDTEAGSILAATLEASLNRLYGEQQLESHREELNQQTERAQRLDSIAELTHRVEAAITRESTRKGIQKAVCNELTSVDQFAGAMTATGEVGTNRLTTETIVGIESRLVHQSLSAPEKTQKASHPAIKAWQSNEACVAEDILRGVTGGVGNRYPSCWNRRCVFCADSI